MTKSAFNRYEKKILLVLGRTGRMMSINEISERTNFSRQTVKKYLEILRARGFLVQTK
jgi:DNA-binding IclR family transcriptional regulator